MELSELRRSLTVGLKLALGPVLSSVVRSARSTACCGPPPVGRALKVLGSPLMPERPVRVLASAWVLASDACP